MLSKETVEELINEVKAAVRDYLRDAENTLRKRLKRLLVVSVVGLVLVALVVSFVGSAVIFIAVGSLKYLSLFLPAWQAWIVMGVVSIVVGVLLLVVVFLIIRRELSRKRQG